MKIGIAIQHFDPFRGGAENWTFQFVERLLQRGHEVHVVAQQFSPDAEKLPLTPHRLGFVKRRLARADAAAVKLQSLDLDVIHDMGMGWYCDVFESHDGSRMALWTRKLRTLPRCLRPFKQAAFKVLPHYTELTRLMNRQLDDPHRLVLALSRFVASDYQRFHGIPAERLRIIHNGVDAEHFSPNHRAQYREPLRRQLGVENADLLLLFVGHDYRRKGLATAVRAVNRLRSAEVRVRLAVVGGNPQKRRSLGANGEAFLFLGSMRDVRPYYAAADAFVLPSFYDPCSLSVLEAAASGLPSVTTHANGAGELLTDGVSGILLSDPADDKTLANRLHVLLDPARRRQMGEAARAIALSNTLDSNCERILGLYEEVIRRGHNRRRPRVAAAA